MLPTDITQVMVYSRIYSWGVWPGRPLKDSTEQWHLPFFHNPYSSPSRAISSIKFIKTTQQDSYGIIKLWGTPYTTNNEWSKVFFFFFYLPRLTVKDDYFRIILFVHQPLLYFSCKYGQFVKSIINNYTKREKQVLKNLPT